MSETARTKEPRRACLADEAAEIRRDADPAEVQAIIEESRPVAAIGIRERLDLFHRILERERLPKDPGRRMVRLKHLIEQERANLAKREGRYRELRQFGLEALSDYDLTIPYSGDGLAALRFALKTVDAHISFSLSMLLVLDTCLASAHRELCGGAEQLTLL